MKQGEITQMVQHIIITSLSKGSLDYEARERRDGKRIEKREKRKWIMEKERGIGERSRERERERAIDRERERERERERGVQCGKGFRSDIMTRDVCFRGYEAFARVNNLL